jgi:FtsH-binding integral membrane protein
MGQKVAWILSLALLVATGVLGVYNGITEWGEGQTAMQRSVTAGVLLYGLFGLATAFGLFQRHAWSVGTSIAWAAALTYVPGVAITAYDESGSMMSAIAASAVTGLIAAAVVWTAHRTTRREPEIERAAQ